MIPFTEIQICGEGNGFRFGYIDLEGPHPSGVSIKAVQNLNLKFIRAFWTGDTVLGVITSGCQCHLGLKSLLQEIQTWAEPDPTTDLSFVIE